MRGRFAGGECGCRRKEDKRRRRSSARRKDACAGVLQEVDRRGWVAKDVEMKLLTHNMLSCNIRGVQNGFPMKIEADQVEETHVDFDADFLRQMYPKLEWKALKEAADGLGVSGLPDECTEEMLDDEDFLRAFHHALLEVHVEEGWLVCPETGRKFPISKGIPNLLLNEDEV